MSESSQGQLQNYSVDQAAGAVVLVLGAVASLLLVIWQSRCHCKMNLCYIFQCERRPPSEDEMDGLKDQAQKLKDKKNKKDTDKKTKTITEPEPEPEPEPEMEDLL
tara:strand:+ start:217 stop:534 length:318 start_codon:yes stop_codon:yes gene_type:complete